MNNESSIRKQMLKLIRINGNKTPRKDVFYNINDLRKLEVFYFDEKATYARIVFLDGKVFSLKLQELDIESFSNFLHNKLNVYSFEEFDSESSEETTDAN